MARENTGKRKRRMKRAREKVAEREAEREKRPGENNGAKCIESHTHTHTHAHMCAFVQLHDDDDRREACALGWGVEVNNLTKSFPSFTGHAKDVNFIGSHGDHERKRGASFQL